MTVIATISQYLGYIAAIITALAIIIKPLRNRLFGLTQLREGLKCQLRSDMLHSYYRHQDEQTIRQYEYENFVDCYEAYKALHGNSFIDKVYAEVKGWKVVT